MDQEDQTQAILVIDDNSANLGVIFEYLESCGFEVITARDGESGIQKAVLGRPDMILLDIMMPEMNGFEICRRLKAEPAIKEIPVIFMTALTDVEDKLRGFAAGGVDYITKPVQEAELLARVRLHLQLQAQRQQLKLQALELKHAKELAEAAQRAAENASQAKSIFLANMSHELRTPLNAILGFARLSVRQTDVSPQLKNNLKIINRSGEHLLTLINQVLDLSKIEAGKITLDERHFDLYKLLSVVEEMFRLRVEQENIYLRFDRAPDVPQYVQTDEVKLRQVLINLLNNALKFTKEGGVTVRIENCQLNIENCKEAAPDPQSSMVYLQFSISDTGPGITPEEMGRVFEAFTQTKTGRRSREGTGLGLAISRRFVQLMGGDISVQSDPGHGATFSFEIQVGVADSTEVPEAVSYIRAIALEPGQPHYRVLVVDDDPDNRELLVELLVPFGFDLKEARNSLEAAAIWEQWEPHMVFMNLRMPIMNGYEAIKQIQTAPKKHASVIIGLSASNLEEEKDIALSKGCDDFLHVPFQDNEIIESLRKHLGVQFVYEQENMTSPLDKVDKSMLSPAVLEPFPKDLRDELQQAIEAVDPKKLNDMLERIRQHNAPFAENLGELLKTYRFDLLQRLFEE